jgi:hypothetical protein
VFASSRSRRAVAVDNMDRQASEAETRAGGRVFEKR